MTEGKNSKSFDMQKSDTKNFSKDLKNETLLNTFLQKKASLKKHIRKNALPSTTEIKPFANNLEKTNTVENFEKVDDPSLNDLKVKNFPYIEEKKTVLNTDLKKNSSSEYNDTEYNSSSFDLKKTDSRNDNSYWNKFLIKHKDSKNSSNENLKKKNSFSATLVSKNSFNAVSENKEESNAVSENKEESNAVSEKKEESNAVSENKEESNAASENKEEFNAASENKEESNAVSESKEESNAVSENKEESNAVSENKEESNAGSENKEEFNAASENKEESNAVSETKEKSNAVPENKEESNAAFENKKQSIAASENKEESNAASENKKEFNAASENKEESNAVSENNEKSNAVPEKKEESNAASENKKQSIAASENKEESNAVSENKKEFNAASENKEEFNAVSENKADSNASFRNIEKSNAASEKKEESNGVSENKKQSIAVSENKAESNAAFENKAESNAAFENKAESNAASENKNFFGSDLKKKAFTSAKMSGKDSSSGNMKSKEIPYETVVEKDSSGRGVAKKKLVNAVSDEKNVSSEDLKTENTFSGHIEPNSVGADFQSIDNSSAEVEKKHLSTSTKKNQGFSSEDNPKPDLSNVSSEKKNSIDEELEKKKTHSDTIEEKNSLNDNTRKKTALSEELYKKNSFSGDNKIKNFSNGFKANNHSSSSRVENKNLPFSETEKKNISSDALKAKEILENALKKSVSTGSNASMNRVGTSNTINENVSKVDDELNDPENNIKKILKIQGFLEILEVLESDKETKKQLPSPLHFPQRKSHEFLETLISNDLKRASSDKHNLVDQEPILNKAKKPTSRRETPHVDAQRLSCKPTESLVTVKEEQQRYTSPIPQTKGDKTKSPEIENVIKGKEKVPFLQRKTQILKSHERKYSTVPLPKKETAIRNGVNLMKKPLERSRRSSSSLQEKNEKSFIPGELQRKENDVEKKRISKNIEAIKISKPAGHTVQAKTKGLDSTNLLRGAILNHQSVQAKAKEISLPSNEFHVTVNKRTTDKTKREDTSPIKEPVKRLINRKAKPNLHNIENINSGSKNFINDFHVSFTDTNTNENRKTPISSVRSGQIVNKKHSIGPSEPVSVNLDKTKKEGHLKLNNTDSVKSKIGKDDNSKEKQPGEMMALKHSKKSQPNQIEDSVKLMPEDKETSSEVSKVITDIDESCKPIEKVQVKKSEQNEKTSVEKKQSETCVLVERESEGGENSNTTTKQDEIKGKELKVIYPVELGDFIGMKSPSMRNISSRLMSIKKMNSEPISKLFKSLSSNFEERFLRKSSEPCYNLMWLPSSAEDSTEVGTVLKNVISDGESTTVQPNCTMKDSVMSESATKQNLIEPKINGVSQKNNAITSDVLSKKEKININKTASTEVEKQSSKVINFPVIKKFTLKKNDSLYLAKRSISFKPFTAYGMTIKRNGQNDKLTGLKNLETGSLPTLNSKEKSSKKSVNERMDRIKLNVSNSMVKKKETSSFSSNKPAIKKTASPRENVTRPIPTSEMPTTSLSDAILAKNSESSFTVSPEKKYRNKFLNKLYSQQDIIPRHSDFTHTNSIKSSTVVDLGSRMPKKLKQQKNGNVQNHVKQDILQTTDSTNKTTTSLPFIKRTVSLCDLQKSKALPLRKCRSLDFLERMNLSNTEIQVDEISKKLMNTNPNSNLLSSEVTTKNLTIIPQNSQNKALKIKKNAPLEVVTTVDSPTHQVQKKKTTSKQADTNLSPFIKHPSLADNKMKQPKQERNTTHQEKNGLFDNKVVAKSSQGLNESYSTKQKDVTKRQSSTQLGTDLARRKTKSTEKKINKLSEKKDNKVIERKDIKLSEKKDIKTKVPTLTKAVTVKLKTPRKLGEKGVALGNPQSTAYNLKITKVSDTVSETNNKTDEISKTMTAQFVKEKKKAEKEKKKITNLNPSNTESKNGLKADFKREPEANSSNRRETVNGQDPSQLFSFENNHESGIGDGKNNKKNVKNKALKSLIKLDATEKAKPVGKKEAENDTQNMKGNNPSNVVMKVQVSKETRMEDTKQTQGREKKVTGKKKSTSPTINAKVEKEKNNEIGKKIKKDFKDTLDEEVLKIAATNQNVTNELSGKMKIEKDEKVNLLSKRKSLTKWGLQLKNKKDSSKESITKKSIIHTPGFLASQGASNNLQKRSSFALLSRMDSQNRKSNATLSNQALQKKKTSFPVFNPSSRKVFNSRRKINKILKSKMEYDKFSIVDSSGKKIENKSRENIIRISTRILENPFGASHTRNDGARLNSLVTNSQNRNSISVYDSTHKLDIKLLNHKKDLSNNITDCLRLKPEERPDKQADDDLHKGSNEVNSEDIAEISPRQSNTKESQNTGTSNEDEYPLHENEKKTEPVAQTSITGLKTHPECSKSKGAQDQSETNGNENQHLRKHIKPIFISSNKRENKPYTISYSNGPGEFDNGMFTIIKNAVTSEEKKKTFLEAFQEMQEDTRLPINTFTVMRNSSKNVVDADSQNLGKKKYTSKDFKNHMKNVMERENEGQRCTDFFPTHMVNEFATKCVNFCSWPIQLSCGQLLSSTGTLDREAANPAFKKTLNEWQRPYKLLNVDSPIKNFKNKTTSDPYVMFAADTPLHVTAHYSKDSLC